MCLCAFIYLRGLCVYVRLFSNVRERPFSPFGQHCRGDAGVLAQCFILLNNCFLINGSVLSTPKKLITKIKK